MRRLLPLLVVAGLAAAAPASHAAPVAFGAPQRLTPDTAGGYEPAVATDRHGRIFVTAHKENSTLVVAPAPGETVPGRTASWAWMSVDGGRSYAALEAPPGAGDPTMPGIESDLVADDAGHVYLADISVADVLLHRWTVRGESATWDFTTRLGTAREDDRPWLAAHGDGRLLYLSNGAAAGDEGDFTAFVSGDGGRTFSEPTVLDGSDWCRPTADRTPGARGFYVVCSARGGEGGYAFVSGDDGATWRRTALPGTDRWELFPSIATDSRGTVVAATAVPIELGKANPVVLFVSRDHGRTWRREVLALPRGEWSYATVDLRPGGVVGFAAYYRAAPTDDWQVRAGVFRLGQLPQLAVLDSAAAGAASPYPSGDLMGAAFDSRGRLTVSWTRTTVMVADPRGYSAVHLHREIWAATQR